MKKYIVNYLFLFVSTFALLSCYEDKSKLDTNKLPEVRIEIDGYDDGKIKVGFNQLLEIKPRIYKQNVENHSDLDVKWELSQFDSVDDFETISSTFNLDYVVNRGITSKPYILKLTIWDKKVDYKYYKYFELYVSSSYGEGIIVSYTDDNINSDIALIMDQQISDSYKNSTPLIRKDLYSLQNGEKIDALITSSCYTKFGGTSPTYWFALSNGGYLSLDCEAYNKNDAEMIFTPEGFRAGLFTNSHQYLMLFASDGLYKIGKINDRKPTVPSMSASAGAAPSNYMVSTDSYSQGDGPNIVWYNENNGSFYYASAFAMTPTKYTAPDTELGIPAFDWSDLPNKECKAASVSYDGSSHAFLMKDKSSGEYEIYGITRGYYDNDGNYYSDVPKSVTKIPESANSVLNNAVSIFFMYDQTILYVATATDIYTINFVTTPALFNATPQYSAPSGETIVVAKLYQQGQFTEDRGEIVIEQPLNNKAIYFATMKNGNQGTVWVVPMVKNLVSSGVLEKDATKFLKYEGFSKILDISVQGI